MKYLLSCLIALPLVASCTVIQEEYYEPGYYAPPPGVEVERYAPPPVYYRDNQPHYHGHTAYRPAPRGRVYHGHPNTGRGNPVVVNPRGAQTQVPPQQNIHGHPSTGQNGGTLHVHPGTSSGNIHGHPNTGGSVQIHPSTSAATTHGHPESANSVVVTPPVVTGPTGQSQGKIGAGDMQQSSNSGHAAPVVQSHS